MQYEVENKVKLFTNTIVDQFKIPNTTNWVDELVNKNVEQRNISFIVK